LHERTVLRRRLKVNGFFSESIGVFLPGYAEGLNAIAKQDHAEILRHASDAQMGWRTGRYTLLTMPHF
jgi:hypothetical protein